VRFLFLTLFIFIAASRPENKNINACVVITEKPAGRELVLTPAVHQLQWRTIKPVSVTSLRTAGMLSDSTG